MRKIYLHPIELDYMRGQLRALTPCHNCRSFHHMSMRFNWKDVPRVVRVYAKCMDLLQPQKLFFEYTINLGQDGFHHWQFAEIHCTYQVRDFERQYIRETPGGITLICIGKDHHEPTLGELGPNGFGVRFDSCTIKNVDLSDQWFFQDHYQFNW